MQPYPPRAWTGRLSLSGLALSLLLVWPSGLVCAQQASPAVARLRALAQTLKVYRSPSGRVAVVGANTGENLTVGRWADDVLARFEKATGIDCPSPPGNPITITVQALASNAVASITVTERGQRLRIHGGFEVDRASADRILCAFLIDRCVAAYRSTHRIDGATVPAAAPPAWLVSGLARSLYAARRAQDAAAALAAWRKAQLPTIAACLSAVRDDGDAMPPWGFLVSSLLRRKASPGLMESAVAELARGGALDIDWLCGTVFDGVSPADVEVWWDGVVLKQRRVVRAPGQLTSAGREAFEAALLLYPGTFGMPLSRTLYEPIEWSRLIAMKREPWIPEFCRRKATSLRMLAAGRGEDIEKAADAYAVFLQDLARGKRDSRLRDGLDAAEACLALLRAADNE
jgi:hypothetical protein